jgi:hypothetical protein
MDSATTQMMLSPAMPKALIRRGLLAVFNEGYRCHSDSGCRFVGFYRADIGIREGMDGTRIRLSLAAYLA